MELTPQGQAWLAKFKADEAELANKANQYAKMLDYKSTVGKYCNGYVSIGFRLDAQTAEYAINENNYILNSCGDGWFRKDNSCGITSSHGLMIRSAVRITSRKEKQIGDFLCYKAEIIYETNNFDPEILVDKFWIFVQKEIDIKYVLDYIDNHLREWKA